MTTGVGFCYYVHQFSDNICKYTKINKNNHAFLIETYSNGERNNLYKISDTLTTQKLKLAVYLLMNKER